MNDDPPYVWHARGIGDFSLHPALNRWILHIEWPSGRITLNPEIAQGEAVQEFVRLCNEMVEAHDGKDRKDAAPGTLILLNEEIGRLQREAQVYKESADMWREQYLELEAKVADLQQYNNWAKPLVIAQREAAKDIDQWDEVQRLRLALQRIHTGAVTDELTRQNLIEICDEALVPPRDEL